MLHRKQRGSSEPATTVGRGGDDQKDASESIQKARVEERQRTVIFLVPSWDI